MYIYRGKLTYSDYLQNEGVTLVFPAGFALDDPVYTCWQWTKTSQGNVKESFFGVSSIDSVKVTDNDTTITYSNYDYYGFVITISDSINSISLTMTDPNNTSVDTQLHLVDGQAPNIELDLTQLRIYMGKLSYGGGSVKYLDNETLFFVAPTTLNEGDTICLFFQWTVTDDGSNNVNVDLVTPISNVTSTSDDDTDDDTSDDTSDDTDDDDSSDDTSDNDTSPVSSFNFYLADNYYTFTATVDEKALTLALQMADSTGTADGTVNTTLTLQDLDLDQSSGSLGLVQRWARETTEVINDSDEIIVCSLNASGSGVTDKILAVASLVVGGVGLVVALPSALPLAVGTYAASIGWFAAVGGMGLAFRDAGEDVAGVLFPGDSLKRDSAYFGSNDLYINLARVEDDTTLKVSYAKKADVRTVTLNLADYLPGGSSALTFNQQFAFKLPKAMKLLAYRVIVIQGLEIGQTGNDVSSMTEADVANALSTYDKSTSSSSWYGTLDTYIGSVNPGDTLFSVSPGVSLTFAQGSSVYDSGGSGAELLHVTIKNGPKKLDVLKLRSCLTANADGHPLEECSKDEVTGVIGRWGSFDAYRWRSSSSWLYGFKFEEKQNLTVTLSSTVDDCVYLVAESVNPVHSLIYKDTTT